MARPHDQIRRRQTGTGCERLPDAGHQPPFARQRHPVLLTRHQSPDRLGQAERLILVARLAIANQPNAERASHLPTMTRMPPQLQWPHGNCHGASAPSSSKGRNGVAFGHAGCASQVFRPASEITGTLQYALNQRHKISRAYRRTSMNRRLPSATPAHIAQKIAPPAKTPEKSFSMKLTPLPPAGPARSNSRSAAPAALHRILLAPLLRLGPKRLRRCSNRLSTKARLPCRD